MDNETLMTFLGSFPQAAMHFFLRVVLALLVIFISLRIIRALARLTRRSMDRAHVDQSVINFVCSFINVGLKVFLVFAILAAFGVNTASIIAVLGSAGVAIGLAVQGSLSNLAGGVMILALRPFKVGDYIQEDTHGHEGTVREISLFTTKLTTYDNKIVILPNGDLANTSLTNLTGATSRMLEIKVGVAYDTDLQKAKDALRKIAEEHPSVRKDKPVQVFVDSFGDSALMMGLRCWIPTDGFKRLQWEINEQIKYALDEAGIVIPFPQREVRMISTS